MRFALVALALTVAGTACAEREIYIPTAKKLAAGTFKYELRYDPKESYQEQYLGVGVTPFWEVEMYDRDNRNGTFDLTYNLITPLTDLTPGLAFGYQDVLNKTDGGSRPFAVATFRQGFFVIGGEQPADVTLGLTYSHSRLLPIVGVRIPFSEHVRVLAENDGRNVSAALEIQPLRPLTISFMVRENHGLIGFSLQHKF